ncbi:carbonic anhydrase [Maioricimonas sp. JC845]|uniref:carbonic anhydrase n=1 Tax=Maioricimonas sp. JC845 TaxID=3232138 RepID=UPI003459B215
MIDRVPVDGCVENDSDYVTSRELLRASGYGEEPIIAMVACSDMPCAPDDVLGTNPGELYVVQNPGNMVPPEAAVEDVATLSSLWFALQVPTIRYLIVCGHTLCRCRSSAVDATRTESPDGGTFLNAVVTTHGQIATRPDVVRAGRHALRQVEALRTHMFIGQRLQRRTLRLHACVVDDQTGYLHSFNPTTGRFELA